MNSETNHAGFKSVTLFKNYVTLGEDLALLSSQLPYPKSSNNRAALGYAEGHTRFRLVSAHHSGLINRTFLFIIIFNKQLWIPYYTLPLCQVLRTCR